MLTTPMMLCDLLSSAALSSYQESAATTPTCGWKAARAAVIFVRLAVSNASFALRSLRVASARCSLSAAAVTAAGAAGVSHGGSVSSAFAGMPIISRNSSSARR